MIAEGLIEGFKDRIGVFVHRFDDQVNFPVPEGMDSNGWGEAVKMHPLRGTLEIRPYGTEQIIEIPGSKVGTWQYWH